MKLLGIPDITEIETDEGGNQDTVLRFQEKSKKLQVFIKAEKSHPRYIKLIWNMETVPDALLLGDAWERSYANLGWKSLENAKAMPWYFLCEEKDRITAAGIMVRPAAFVSWRVTAKSVCATLDVRCGGEGVDLIGRELIAAEIVCREYSGDAFSAACDFCGCMCESPLLPKTPVYGGNNWYYAYGESSRDEILSDARFQSELAGDASNRPFMVIDDGWQEKRCSGPWVPNREFGDMSKIAAEMKKISVRPGLWVRYLKDDSLETAGLIRLQEHGKSKGILDPSDPTVLKYIGELTRKFTGWGYELIKYDFTTYDIFGFYAFERAGEDMLAVDGWSFCDKTRTTAQIITALYKTILDNCGSSILIGCNTVSHLCAGLVHLNRIGDDTSGTDWERTSRYGVNTLAFRIPQHNRFYAVDADCVGIKDIPWEKNSKWLKLLANSGTPLFVSCPDGTLDEKQKEQLKEAYRHAAVQNDRLIPTGWKDGLMPEKWNINGKENYFKWCDKGEYN